MATAALELASLGISDECGVRSTKWMNKRPVGQNNKRVFSFSGMKYREVLVPVVNVASLYLLGPPGVDDWCNYKKVIAKVNELCRDVRMPRPGR